LVRPILNLDLPGPCLEALGSDRERMTSRRKVERRLSPGVSPQHSNRLRARKTDFNARAGDNRSRRVYDLHSELCLGRLLPAGYGKKCGEEHGGNARSDHARSLALAPLVFKLKAER
jgi:hypothetical protein